MRLRELLNRILWDESRRPADYEVIYIDRGAPESRSTTTLDKVAEVAPSWIAMKDDDEQKTVPLHRVLLLRNIQTGEIEYSKRQGAVHK